MISLKTSQPPSSRACGNAGCSGATVVTTLVLPTRCTRGCGCSGPPAFPAPSEGEGFMHHPGASRRGNAKLRLESKRRQLRANGSRERAPDDRLRAAIHLAASRKNGLLRRFAPRNDDLRLNFLALRKLCENTGGLRSGGSFPIPCEKHPRRAFDYLSDALCRGRRRRLKNKRQEQRRLAHLHELRRRQLAVLDFEIA